MQRKRDVYGLTADPAAVGNLPFWRPPLVYDARIRFGRSSEIDPAPIFNPVDVDLAGRHYVHVRQSSAEVSAAVNGLAAFGHSDAAVIKGVLDVKRRPTAIKQYIRFGKREGTLEVE